jgi:hypothetical protein
MADRRTRAVQLLTEKSRPVMDEKTREMLFGATQYRRR